VRFSSESLPRTWIAGGRPVGANNAHQNKNPDDQNADSLYVDHSLERHPGRGPLEDEPNFGTIGKAFNKAFRRGCWRLCCLPLTLAACLDSGDSKNHPPSWRMRTTPTSRSQATTAPN